MAAVAEVATDSEYRVAMFVGNDRGAAGETPLVFATSDAAKMQALFVGTGGVDKDDALLLLDGTRRDLQGAMVTAKERLVAAEARGAHTSLVFYYSGHGDEEGLQLGDTRVGHDELRAWLEATGADVRIAFLDSCRSGAAVRAKGGVRGPGYAFAVDVERAAGTAILTSSAETEFSQESDEVGGGFFTYYLHSGLAGAADGDGDGVVTLDEVYRWVHTETAFRTRTTPGSQTPSYDLDLAGSGSIALTQLAPSDARLVFPGGLDGTLAVWDESRKRYVAEVIGANRTVIAVRPGVYAIQRREPGWVDEAQVTVREGASVDVGTAAFQSVAYEDTSSRGDIDQQVRRASRPDLAVMAVFGGRTLGGMYATTYVPQHSVGGIQVETRFHNGVWGQFDAIAGSGAGLIALPDLDPIAVNMGSATFGATLGVAGEWKFLHGGLGARAESAWFWRSFPDGEQVPQRTWAIAPGASAVAGVDIGHVRADLGFSLMVFPASFDGNSFPGFGETTLRLGYVF